MRAVALEVRHAEASDVPALAPALAEAFYDDPVFRWWVPDDARRVHIFGGFFELLLTHMYLPLGEVYTTPDRAGGALWAPPGRWRSDEAQMAAIAPQFVAVLGEYLPASMTLLGLMETHHPDEPHYYLPMIGTHPDRQGEGIGSALLRPILGRCDAEGIGSYLEATTVRSRALYERTGFEAIGEIAIPDGPVMWPMWRHPRAA